MVTQDKCLLFEPNSPSSRKFLEIVMPKIQAAGALLLHRAVQLISQLAAYDPGACWEMAMLRNGGASWTRYEHTQAAAAQAAGVTDVCCPFA